LVLAHGAAVQTPLFPHASRQARIIKRRGLRESKADRMAARIWFC
jgi:hypothetical protein